MVRESHLDFEVQGTKLNCRQNCLEVTADLESDNTVRCSSHWGRSPQNRLGDEQTCGMTLASAYVLCSLSAI